MKPYEQCWILVADGHRARVIRPNWRNHTWTTIENLIANDAHLAKHQGERAGRSFESASSTRHAIAPHNEPQALDRHDFAATVAQTLAEGLAAGAYDTLVVIAAKQFLGELRKQIDHDVAATITLELDRDLTKLDDRALFEHLAELPGGMRWRALATA